MNIWIFTTDRSRSDLFLPTSVVFLCDCFAWWSRDTIVYRTRTHTITLHFDFFSSSSSYYYCYFHYYYILDSYNNYYISTTTITTIDTVGFRVVPLDTMWVILKTSFQPITWLVQKPDLNQIKFQPHKY